MQTICVFKGHTHQEALCVKAILETNEIIAMMPDEHMSAIIPPLSFAKRGFDILVPRTQFIEAGELLNSLNYKIENAELIENLTQPDKSKYLELCPECGSRSLETKLIPRKSFLAYIFSILVSRPINARTTAKYCHICNKNIKTK